MAGGKLGRGGHDVQVDIAALLNTRVKKCETRLVAELDSPHYPRRLFLNARRIAMSMSESKAHIIKRPVSKLEQGGHIMSRQSQR